VLILWHNLKSEETCKNNVLKRYANWKYGTDVTCAGAIEKLEVATAGNTDAPPRDARSNGKMEMESTHGCPVLSQPRHTQGQGHGLFIHVTLVM
jgi:hypothetical protein